MSNNKRIVMVRCSVVLMVISALVNNAACYSIPEPTFEILQPKGLRVSIPDTAGLQFFAFHGAIDSQLTGPAPGDFVGEVMKPQNGRWVYENENIAVEPEQTLYYWINVQHSGKGYRMLGRSYRVPQTGSKDNPTPKPSEPNSNYEESITTVRGRKVNRGELIFEDHFDVMNFTKWRREIRIPLDTDDADFVLYENYTDNCYTINGNLHISATPLDEVPGYNRNAIKYGEINLGSRCTGVVDTEKECKRKAGYSLILPPIVSARLSTRESFAFRYGKIEVRAKLPKGDWLFPLITLDPLTSDYGVLRYASGQMRVAFIRGNIALWTKDNVTIDGSYLSGGVIFKKSSSNDRERWLKQVAGKEHWGNDFHTYELTWTDSSISLGYDGNNYAQINGGFHQNLLSSMAPFDREFYITLALSVGGLKDFPEDSYSPTYRKPWDNTDPKAELNFYNAKNKWRRTWTQDSDLVIDYVKVWAL